VIVEVISRSTQRLDEGEKKEGYLTIPSLAVYLPRRAGIAADRRISANGARFCSRNLRRSEAVVPLEGVEVELPLAEVYEGVEFLAESNEDEQA